MKRVLFVSNGHGEEAIAARLATEVAKQADVQCDHLALVGNLEHPSPMREVGPRRAMPSGGLIAMGNTTNIWRDLRGGLVGHTLAQLGFLRGARGSYGVAVAVGDIFALLMAKRTRAQRTIFVGTAKSVFVAPYGPLEERVLRGADAVFVRDEPTAERLRSHGVDAGAANVIVDLFSERGDPVPVFDERLAIFPGSRHTAYEDAVFLCAVVRAVAASRPALGATLSLAPGLDAHIFAGLLERDGWEIVPAQNQLVPFSLARSGRTLINAWRGLPGEMLRGAVAVLGQAGTANEAAAAQGIPVIAFEPPGTRQHGWYRMRQRGLLGEALRVVDGDVAQAAQSLERILDDQPERARIGAIGRDRMGPAGGAAAIAAKIVSMVEA